jgi:uncharacterized lipoprotein YddW (UPF0748 family)
MWWIPAAVIGGWVVKQILDDDDSSPSSNYDSQRQRAQQEFQEDQERRRHARHTQAVHSWMKSWHVPKKIKRKVNNASSEYELRTLIQDGIQHAEKQQAELRQSMNDFEQASTQCIRLLNQLKK